MLLAATGDGVFRIERLPFDRTQRTLDGVTVRQLCADPESRSVYAATDAGLHRTRDGGQTWRVLDLPTEATRSVAARGEQIRVGVAPAGILESNDGGATWSRLRQFDAMADDVGWPTNPQQDTAVVRSISSPSGRSATILAGVEVGGLLLSEDGGETWRKADAIPDDVHQVHPVDATNWLVACGTGGPSGDGGVFETNDAGRTWTQRALGDHGYVREVFHDGRLHVGGCTSPPRWNPAEAGLFMEDTDDELVRVAYPGEPESFILAWTAVNGRKVAGTNDGRILYKSGGEWNEAGRIPVSQQEMQAFGVRSLAPSRSALGRRL